MNRCVGGSRKFSRLEQEELADSDERPQSPLQQPEQQQQERESALAISPQQDEKTQRLSPSSPSRRKRILQSLANCSPSRKEKLLMDEHGTGESGAFPSATAAPMNGQVHPQTLPPITAHGVTHHASASQQSTATTDRSTIAPSWRIPPMYNDESVVTDDDARRKSRTVFRQISKENGVRESVEEHAVTQTLPTPAEPALLGIKVERVESQDAPPSTVSFSGHEPSAIQVESLSEIEALIARVKRLDDIVQAGEATVTTTATATTTREDEKMPGLFVSTTRSSLSPSEFSDASVESPPHEAARNMDRSPYFQPIDMSEHCSLDGHAESSDTGSEASCHSHSNTTKVLGGVNGFKDLHRRHVGSNSPLNRLHAPCTVVSSSIATVSSFGIPTVTPIYKPLPISPRYQSRSSSLTAHSFFWRTHPRETFTSYGPNRPKAKLSLLSSSPNQIIRPKEGQLKFSPGTTRIGRGVFVTENDKVDDANNHEPTTNPDADTFWSAKTDPVLTNSQDVTEELGFIKSMSQYRSRIL